MKLCEKCQAECLNFAPQWGKHIESADKFVFVGTVPLKPMLKIWRKKKIIRFWIGTDVLLLYKFPPGRGKLAILLHRLKSWLIEPFIAEHWAYGERLFEDFKKIWSKRKAKLRLCTPPMKPVVKIPHEGVNIAYYHPKDDVYSRWVYGLDLIRTLMLLYPKVNWIKLDGTLNPDYFFQILDAYIRPSRYDGNPRLVTECKFHNIPVYWSENHEPNFDELCNFVESLL